MTPAPHPVLRRIDAHHVILETDGWLCFKYLDCGEESISPFADVSKGDIIEWGLPGHTSASSDVLELLNDLRHYANGEYKEADVSDDEDKMRIHLEYENRIWDIMKKIRQQQQERKDGI